MKLFFKSQITLITPLMVGLACFSHKTKTKNRCLYGGKQSKRHTSWPLKMKSKGAKNDRGVISWEGAHWGKILTLSSIQVFFFQEMHFFFLL